MIDKGRVLMKCKGFPHILSILLIISIFISCSTVAPSIGSDWNEEMFFKSALEAFDENDLESALFYYQVSLHRYPENLQKTIAAEYEIAFIYYKMEEYEKSHQLFEKLLEKYESDSYAYLYPPAYKILAENVNANIERWIEIKDMSFFERGNAKKTFWGTGRDKSEIDLIED